MADDLRHCICCRDAGRECDVAVTKAHRGELEGYQVSCATCGTCGPVEDTEEQATGLWNDNTELVATALDTARHMEMLIGISHQWQQRAAGSMKFLEGVAALLKKFTEDAKEQT